MPHHSRNNISDIYNTSIRSAETENTYIPTTFSTTPTVYIDNTSSSNGGSSQVSLINSPNGSGTSLDTTNYDNDIFFDVYLSATGVLEFEDNTKLIFQGVAGRVRLILIYT